MKNKFLYGKKKYKNTKKKILMRKKLCIGMNRKTVQGKKKKTSKEYLVKGVFK